MERFIACLVLIIKFCVADVEQQYDINGFLFKENPNFDIVDLTYDYDRQNPNNLCIGVPMNFNSAYQAKDVDVNKRTVDSLPVQHLFLPLIIADISEKVNVDSKFELTKSHLDHFLNNYFGRTYQPCLIVFKFGWSQFHRDHDKYFGVRNGNTTLEYPGVSEEVARWIVSSYKNVVGVGVDLPSLDPGRLVEESPALKTLTAAGVYVINNVKLDQYLPDAACSAVVLPMKMAESCVPYRLIAVCPKPSMTPKPQIMHRLLYDTI